MLKAKISNHLRAHYPFYLLLVLGIGLRLWMMLGSGLSNDELSAWHRTRLHSWDEFWYYGVKFGDMHPVFYQALLWCWVRIFGDSDFVFRLPALLFWIASMGLLYRIACAHFSRFSGWLVIAMYAGLSFFVVNTTTSRPYNSGVFFILLAWFVYLNHLKTQNDFNWKSILLLAGALSGAMLSHYFACLTVGLISAVAFFFGNKGQKVQIAFAGILATLLFLLHFSVTWFQVTRGGLEWLGEPNWYWMAEFWHQVFQYVWLFSIPVFFLMLWAGFQSKWSVQRGFTLAAVVVVCTVAYVLSITFTPILREAVIQFFFPMLVLGVVGGFEWKKSPFNFAIPLALGTLFFLHTALVRTPDAPIHYAVFKEIGTARNDLLPEFNKLNTADLFNANDTSYLHRYTSVRADFNLGYVDNEEMVINAFRFADSCTKEHLFYTWTNNPYSPMHFEALRQYYPRAVSGQSFYGSAYFLLSKNLQFDPIEAKTIAVLVDADSVMSGEFGLNQRWQVGELAQTLPLGAYLNFEITFAQQPENELFLVAVAEDDQGMRMKGGDPVFYRASELTRFSMYSNKGFLAFELEEMLQSTDQLHFYLWNPSKEKVEISSLKFEWVVPPGQS